MLLITIPALSLAWLTDELTHRILVFLMVAMASAAFAAGYRHHRCGFIPIVAIIALGLLSIAAFGTDALLMPNWEKPLTITGSILLVAVHGINLRLGRLPRFSPKSYDHAQN